MGMAFDHAAPLGSGIVKPVASVGGRAAGTALRPVTGMAHAAVGAGMRAQRRAADRGLDSGEPERLLTGLPNDPRVHTMLQRTLESTGVNQLIDEFFDIGLFDHFLVRLTASDGLWRLVDEIAQSPAVLAAVSQQGLGFADQVGRVARERSRWADDRIEGTVGRLRRRPHPLTPADGGEPGP